MDVNEADTLAVGRNVDALDVLRHGDAVKRGPVGLQIEGCRTLRLALVRLDPIVVQMLGGHEADEIRIHAFQDI